MSLILASQSQRRKQILTWLVGDSFQVKPANINEEALSKLARTPDEMVEKLAVAKAKKVALTNPETTIIASDTSVIFNANKDNWFQIGKPKGKQDAINILKTLRGKTHFVFTGVAVFNQKSNKLESTYVKTEVTFKTFSDALLDFYIKTNEWVDKAGGYNIFDREDDFIEKIDGSYTNVMGLPAAQTIKLLKKFAIKPLNNWQEKVEEETNKQD